jgi:hypothetical protein
MLLGYLKRGRRSKANDESRKRGRVQKTGQKIMKSNAYELFPFLVPQRPSTSVVRHPVQKSRPAHDPLPDGVLVVVVAAHASARRRAGKVSPSLLSSKSFHVAVVASAALVCLVNRGRSRGRQGQLMGRHGGGRG